MLARVLTALVITPTAVLALYFGNIPLLIVVLITSGITAQEMFGMMIHAKFKPLVIVGQFLLAGMVVSAWAQESVWIWKTWPIKTVALGLLCFYIFELVGKKIYFPKTDLGGTLRVVLFLGGTFPFYMLIRNTHNGLLHVLFACAVTWIGDTGALFAGKYLGKHPLTSISPKKTKEGLIGNLMVSMLTASVFIVLFKLDPLIYFFSAALISVFGQLGDLHESLTKRFFQVKDSSNILPGHGGLYDRGDSALFVMPVVYYFLCV